MKANIYSVFAALALCVAVEAAAQTCQFVTIKSGNYAVQTNQIITLVGYDWGRKPTVIGFFPDGTQTGMSPLYFQTSAVQSQGSSGYYTYSQPSVFATPLATQIFTGLTNISINTASATLKIETPEMANVISNYVPADAIVIPASATGNVQIILESSPDLVNWTAASPGTYGASAGTNRFFRVRAAVSP